MTWHGVRSVRSTATLAACLVVLALLATPSRASATAAPPGPALVTSSSLLEDAVRCPHGLVGRKVVLLVHGTSVTADENWGWNYVLALPHSGFDVCTVQLPDRELIDIQTTTEYVVYAIRKLAHLTGRRIDVVGLSQGVLQPRWALRWWPDIRNLVDDYVSMAGTNHGSLFADAACVSDCLPSLWQQRVNGSHFLAALNKGDETPGDVSYTSVYSLTDEIIEPTEPTPVAMIKGASNVAVQDVCPGRYVNHVQSASDAVYYGVVLDALTHVGPADPSRVDRDFCTQQFMPYVDPAVAARRTAEIYLFSGVVQSQHSKVSAEPPYVATPVDKAAQLICDPRLTSIWAVPHTPRQRRRPRSLHLGCVRGAALAGSNNALFCRRPAGQVRRPLVGGRLHPRRYGRLRGSSAGGLPVGRAGDTSSHLAWATGLETRGAAIAR